MKRLKREREKANKLFGIEANRTRNANLRAKKSEINAKEGERE